MSKTDELRAMREAKYARANALRGTYPKPGTKPASVAPVAPEPAVADRSEPAEPISEPAAETDDGLCGHRSMNGRTCTREAGHAAKSHRYS
jgi:hypothetical protein